MYKLTEPIPLYITVLCPCCAKYYIALPSDIINRGYNGIEGIMICDICNRDKQIDICINK